MGSCLGLVSEWMTAAKYSGLGILHFKMRELARWFSKIFLDLAFHDAKIFDTDSFSCWEMKSLTILTWQFGCILLYPHKYSSLVIVFKCLPQINKQNDRLQEVNKFVCHQTQTQDSFTKTPKSGLLRKAIMENPQHPLWEMVK